MLLSPSVSEIYPIGSIIEAFAPPNNNWKLCDGSVLVQADYPVYVNNCNDLHPQRWNNWEALNVFGSIDTYGIYIPQAVNFGSKIVAVGEYWVTTTDTENWSHGGFFDTDEFEAVATNGTVLIASECNTSSVAYLAYSTDGENWLSKTLPFSDAWKYPIWNGNVFMVCAAANKRCAKSSDGLTWSSGTNLTIIPDCICSNYPQGNRIIAIHNGFGLLQYSDDDGVTWSTPLKIMQTNSAMMNCVYVNGHFIRMGYYGLYSISENGVDWEDCVWPVLESGSYAIRDYYYSFNQFHGNVAYIEGDYIAVPWNDPVVGVSQDLKKWNITEVNRNQTGYYFANYLNGYLVMGGYGPYIIRTAKTTYNSGTHFSIPDFTKEVGIGEFYKRKYMRVK